MAIAEIHSTIAIKDKPKALKRLALGLPERYACGRTKTVEKRVVLCELPCDRANYFIVFIDFFPDHIGDSSNCSQAEQVLEYTADS